MRTLLNRAKRPDKHAMLHEYIQDGNKLYREDIDKMGFNNVELAVINYCNKHNIKVKKNGTSCWVKTDEDVDVYDIRENVYSKLEHRRMSVNGKTFWAIKNENMLKMSYSRFILLYPQYKKTKYAFDRKKFELIGRKKAHV